MGNKSYVKMEIIYMVLAKEMGSTDANKQLRKLPLFIRCNIQRSQKWVFRKITLAIGFGNGLYTVHHV